MVEVVAVVEVVAMVAVVGVVEVVDVASSDLSRAISASDGGTVVVGGGGEPGGRFVSASVGPILLVGAIVAMLLTPYEKQHFATD